MALSNETLQKFRDYRRAKFGQSTMRAGQAVGGSAETLRTGRSAAETFAARDPALLWERERERFMAEEQAKLGVAKSISAEEQFYYNQEQQERIALLSDLAQRVQLEYQRAQRDADRAQQGAQARANLQGATLWKEAMLINDQLLRTYSLDPNTAQFVDQVTKRNGLPSKDLVKGLKNQATGDAMIQMALAKAEEDPEAQARLKGLVQGSNPILVFNEARELELAPGVSPNDFGKAVGLNAQEVAQARTMAAAKATKETSAYMQAQGVSANQAYADALIAIADDPALDWSQKHNAMISIAGGEDELNAILGQTPNGFTKWDTIKRAAESERAVLDDQLKKKVTQSVDVSGKTFGGNARLGDIMSVMEAYGQATTMAAKANPMKQQDADGDGMPDIEWAPTAQGRFQQILDSIEQYPDLPPMQHAKQTLMESPEFQQFKQQYGYSDDQFAFREMNKMARRQQKANRVADRQKAALNQRLGIGGYQRQAHEVLPGTPQSKAPAVKSPASTKIVAGTESRKAED